MLLSALVGFAVVACSSCASQPAPSDYAYRSATELVLMHGANAVARVPGEFRNSTDAVHFTADGRFLFGVTDSGQVAVIDTRAATTKVIDCAGCTTAQPYAADSIVWWADGGGVSVLDPAEANPAPRLLRTVTLPPGSAPQRTRVLAVHGDDLYLARTARQLSAPETLFVVNAASGDIRSLGDTAANTPIRSAAVNPAGTRFAYAGYDRENPACGDAVVGIVDLASGATTTTAPQPARHSVRSDAARVRWDGDDAVDVVYARWDCSSSELKQLDPPGIWRLTEDRWTEIERGPASQDLPLDGGARVTIVPGAGVDVFVGTLYLTDAAGRREIARDVYAVAATPR